MTLRTSDWQRHRTRQLLLARDGPGCRADVCISPGGRDALPAWSIGHVYPLSLGGSDALANLRLEHLVCNVHAGATPRPVATLIPIPVTRPRGRPPSKGGA